MPLQIEPMKRVPDCRIGYQRVSGGHDDLRDQKPMVHFVGVEDVSQAPTPDVLGVSNAGHENIRDYGGFDKRCIQKSAHSLASPFFCEPASDHAGARAVAGFSKHDEQPVESNHVDWSLVGFLTATFVLGACVWGGFFWSVLNWLEVL